MMVGFVDQNRAKWGVEPICKNLQIARIRQFKPGLRSREGVTPNHRFLQQVEADAEYAAGRRTVPCR